MSKKLMEGLEKVLENEICALVEKVEGGKEMTTTEGDIIGSITFAYVLSKFYCSVEHRGGFDAVLGHMMGKAKSGGMSQAEMAHDDDVDPRSRRTKGWVEPSVGPAPAMK